MANTTPRFRGKKTCERLAATDPSAVRALAMTAREREIAALRAELSENVTKALALDSVRRRDATRAKRARAARDPLAQRRPGNVAQRALRHAFLTALSEARFRTAAHQHDDAIALVERGAETAWSESGTAWPSSLGLPNAYKYRAATSEHTWRVSPSLYGVAAGERARQGLLYLSPTVRVRQGRGTSLVVERREGRRWVRA